MSSKSRSRRTKKSAPTTDGKSIRIKSPVGPKNNRSIKRSIMKFIRTHQENNYKKMMQGGENIPTSAYSLSSNGEIEDAGGGDFEESVKYLMDLTKEAELNRAKEGVMRDRTLKNYDSTADIMDNMNYTTAGVVRDDNSYIPPPTPTYGCLKNGNLPTYRQYSKTLKRFPAPQSPNYNYYSPSNPMPAITQRPVQRILPTPPSFQSSGGGGSEKENGRTNATHRMSEILQYKNKMSHAKHNRRTSFPKVKTTRRRTFNIGKSKSRQKVSVLISNKTIRNRITTEAQLLKQTPINEVKRFLVKRGFIKVGSTTGNDVLREMYESIKMICGEIKNHNPDTLLYNFHNDDDIMR